MAAGRIDVSRGRCAEGFDRFKRNSGFIGLKRGFGDRANDGSRVSLGVGRLDFGRNGFGCRDEVWLGDGAMDDEIRVVGDDVQLPIGKRRKFSPIIWNEEEDNRAKVPTEISVAKKGAFVSLPAIAHGQGSGGVAKGATPEIELDASLMVRGSPNARDPLCFASPLLMENDEMGEVENGEMGEVEHGQDKAEEFNGAPNIYTSRWASDDDSPRDTLLDDNKDLCGAGFNREASPEEGEVEVEDLHESSSRSRGSSVRSHSVGSSCADEDSECELQHGLLLDDKEFEDGSVCVMKNQSEDDLCLFRESRDSPCRSEKMPEGCRSVYDFEKLNEINEGTYGKVYRARDTRTGEIVALKKVKMNIGRERDLDEYGFPLSALREINLLTSLYHPSIVNVKEVVMGDLDSVFMVMECMDHDLKGLMHVMKQPFSTSEVKCLMLQLLEGVKYLHDNWVLHRDLKTSNLLLNNKGELKICDFGMSRQYGSPLKPYTSLVVTLWYRAPELLLGTKEYSTAIDMWSVGCIMAELLAKEPLFSGKSEIDQLDKIFRTLGTPNVKIWPALSTLSGSKASFVQQPYNLLRKKFPATSFTGSSVLSDLGFDLLNKLLTYDPEKRITADAALDHPWFHEVPLPKAKEFMPTFPPQSAKSRLCKIP